jgi:hypothetical protein
MSSPTFLYKLLPVIGRCQTAGTQFSWFLDQSSSGSVQECATNKGYKE